MSDVRINEVMTSNTVTLADETGTYAPWIELYNTAGAPVDLSGVLLSDDSLVPDKWVFPAGPASIVPPRGFIVVFLDGAESADYELHASFRLRGGPLELVLNRGSDLFFADASALGRDRTLGRFPDGGEEIAELEVPTPGAANSGPLTRGERIRGDVDRDGAVDLTDAIDLLDALFRLEPLLHCEPAADANDDGAVDVSDAVRILDFLLGGGPPLPALGARELAECSGNEPPRVAPRPLYHAYPGYPVELRIEATDPEGDRLSYEALDFPPGASLDADTGVVSWTPGEEQLGPFYLMFAVSDDAEPPRRVPGRLVFQVHPLDACVRPDCDPEHGCELRPASLDEECCGSPGALVPDPEVDCPDGGGLYLGRSAGGAVSIDRLVNCDPVSLVPLGQGGHVLALNLEARCLAPSRVLLEVRLETRRTILVDEFVERDFASEPDGFSRLRNLRFIAEGSFEEGAEARLTVAATGEDGARLERTLRVVLTRRAG